MKRLEIVGERYGKLVALRRGSKNKYGRFNWYFRCDCGSEIELDANQARSGNTQSCGCYHAESLTLHKTTHGFAKKGQLRSEYRIWTLMKDRCSNPKSPNFSRYGGRGIKVCERWQTFENFYSDMGLRPEGCSIDRINNDGNYEPVNCKWATNKQQANNKTSNKLFTWHNETLTLAQWSEFFGLSGTVLNSRLARGWSFEVAVSTPPTGAVRRKKAEKQRKAFLAATEPK